MKSKTIIEYEEEVELCPDCLVECDRGSNDIDSYSECPKCEKSDFVGKWRPLEAKKQQITKYIYLCK